MFPGVSQQLVAKLQMNESELRGRVVGDQIVKLGRVGQLQREQSRWNCRIAAGWLRTPRRGC